MNIGLKMKIVIVLMIIYSIFFFINLNFILDWIKKTFAGNQLLWPTVLIISSIVLGTIIITNRRLKEKENRLIRVMLLINPCLLNLLIAVAILSYRYVHKNPDVMVISLIISQLSIPVSFLLGGAWVMKRRKVV